ncbi:MAG: PBSX family phage terminase large subunit [Firmicutes bacterium]|nr:PBSX family phage terminase large subunit [Bacillota bacterium]
MRTAARIDISKAVGGGYGAFWKFRGRYRVVKGSRASKKSKTAALWYIWALRRFPAANLLVIRRTYSSLERSCFSELLWAADRLGVKSEFEFKRSPLEITRRRTGQKIYFRGLDDPMKLTSLSVPRGVLSWVWFEEAYEISSEADFDAVDELIRGRVPDGYFKQITLTFNPWSGDHWLKRRFFDAPPSPDILAMTVTYKSNEFLDEADTLMFERMRLERPERYRVAGLGEWGRSGELVYPDFEIREFDVRREYDDGGVPIFGLDFGFANDPTALFCGIINRKRQVIYVFDEMYERGLTNDVLASRIIGKGYGGQRIVADSAEPKSIAELRRMGISRIAPARKAKGSIISGIDAVRRCRIVILPSCKSFISEISSYTWETSADGTPTNRPRASGDHLMDAMRYAVTDALSGSNFSF